MTVAQKFQVITGKLVNNCEMIVGFAKAVKVTSSSTLTAEAADFLQGPWTLTPLKKRGGAGGEGGQPSKPKGRKGPGFRTIRSLSAQSTRGSDQSGSAGKKGSDLDGGGARYESVPDVGSGGGGTRERMAMREAEMRRKDEWDKPDGAVSRDA